MTRRAQISRFGQPQACYAIVYLPAHGDLSCPRLLAIRTLRLLAGVGPGMSRSPSPSTRCALRFVALSLAGVSGKGGKLGLRHASWAEWLRLEPHALRLTS